MKNQSFDNAVKEFKLNLNTNITKYLKKEDLRKFSATQNQG